MRKLGSVSQKHLAHCIMSLDVRDPALAKLTGLMAKWKRSGLQNHYAGVRFPFRPQSLLSKMRDKTATCLPPGRCADPIPARTSNNKT